MSRDRGDVYRFAFPDDMGGPHPVLVVSRPTNRSTVLVAFITSTSQPVAPDVIPIEGMQCHPHLRGFVRCDQLYVLPKESPEWRNFILRLSEADMALIDAGLKAALELR